MKAYCLIRPQPVYRHEAFVAGLKACGYQVETSYARWPVRPGDVLVSWNRYGANETICDGFEANGGTVLVAENGYVKGRHEGGDYYALARHAHNGRGQWHVGGPERWAQLGVELRPWRTNGDYILVAPNRSFGMTGGVMSNMWADDVVRRLQQVTKRPIRVRHHPGNYASAVPLERDLAGAHAVVIWSSSVGVKALIEGIPVVCEAPWWICKRAAWRQVTSAAGLDLTDHPIEAELRRAALERLAWAQWNVNEIASGEPFRYLLSDTRQTQSAAAV